MRLLAQGINGNNMDIKLTTNEELLIKTIAVKRGTTIEQVLQYEGVKNVINNELCQFVSSQSNSGIYYQDVVDGFASKYGP